ncbi:hypothetical protein B0H12DRAFT_97969 [Mycena haematopus]|nr:hypothetical protein B0H12DRAFT_97969 [Mycena haematopus]
MEMTLASIPRMTLQTIPVSTEMIPILRIPRTTPQTVPRLEIPQSRMIPASMPMVPPMSTTKLIRIPATIATACVVSFLNLDANLNERTGRCNYG